MVIGELYNVLFYDNTDVLIDAYTEFYKLLDMNEFEKHDESVNNFLLKHIKSKENFFSLIENYHKNAKPVWQNQSVQNCDLLSSIDIKIAQSSGTYAHGKKTFELYKDMQAKWAYHLDDYSHEVNFNDNLYILELATGAALGTAAVMNGMMANSCMVSIDIDYGAARNADGLANYMGIVDRASGLNANFWSLPFNKEIFDVVCTHYGLDESGEQDVTLSEISRVLKHSGKFICICRQNPTIRHKKFLDLFNIEEDELIPYLKKARLYAGTEHLAKLSETHGLLLDKSTEYRPTSGHVRNLMIFTKK